MRNVLIWSVCFLYTLGVQAQELEMADKLRTEGKIYVVVGVILIILAGLFLYIFNTDRKLSDLEKEVNKKSTK